MRNLYLIRHAKSSWDFPGLRDFDRPLNERGHRDAPRMARFLQGAGVQPDLLVSSPAKRALTTAEYFAQTFGLPEADIRCEPDVYEASTHDILRIIQRLPDTARVVFLFGHNPTFTDVANRFTEAYIDNIPTCGIVCLESTAAHWAEVTPANTRVAHRYFPKEIWNE